MGASDEPKAFVLNNESIVEVFAAEMRVAGGGLNFEDAAVDVEDGDVEGAAAQVEDEDVLVAVGFLVESVGDGGGRGFVDDSRDVKTA